MSTVIDSESILTQIQTAAAGPSKVSGDAGSVEQFSLTDLVAVHKYLSTTEAALQEGSRRTSGLRFAQMIPGGTVQRGRGFPCR